MTWQISLIVLQAFVIGLAVGALIGYYGFRRKP